jgi:hypothetical protein
LNPRYGGDPRLVDEISAWGAFTPCPKEKRRNELENVKVKFLWKQTRS